MKLVCFILILFPFSFVYAKNDTIVDALLAFKKALDDPTGVLSNWNGSQPCLWDYIHCNLSDVMTVDLGKKSLAGSLVPELGNLSKLEYLRVGSNKINGSIPPELGKLTNLVGLNLGNNSLTGPIPQELGNLKNLKWLLLQDNNLSGRVPLSDPLTNLFPNLIFWNISGNPRLCGILTTNTTCT